MTDHDLLSYGSSFENLVRRGLENPRHSDEDKLKLESQSREFRSVVYAEQESSMLRPSERKKVLPSVAKLLSRSLIGLSNKPAFTTHKQALIGWSEEALLAGSAAELGSICHRASEVLFPPQEGEPFC